MPVAANRNAIGHGATGQERWISVEDLTPRQIKALEIADRFRIVESNGKWLVPSQSGKGKYAVELAPHAANCTCPDHEVHRGECKHILAVKYMIQGEVHADGTTTVTETFEITKKTTYPQQWSAYNAAQIEEKDRFQVLLADLCSQYVAPPQTGRGERRLPLSDALFSSIFKVYSTVSARRFSSDLREAKERGFISHAPHFNSVLNYLEKPEVRPVLTEMIELSALPLKAVETDFACDSSGFGVSRFFRWYDHKYGVVKDRRDWVKVHVMCGTKTNIITAVEIRGRDQGDSTMLPPLLKTTADNFAVANVSADKGYLSYANAKAIADAGATPYIAFKKNSGPGDFRKEGVANTKAWTDMYYAFMFHRDAWLSSYHRRSNVETVFSSVKRKFGDNLRSKTDVAMVNEALAKCLCHNLVTLIHEAHELGIEPMFRTKNHSEVSVARG
jgi:transposase